MLATKLFNIDSFDCTPTRFSVLIEKHINFTNKNINFFDKIVKIIPVISSVFFFFFLFHSLYNGVKFVGNKYCAAPR